MAQPATLGTSGPYPWELIGAPQAHHLVPQSVLRKRGVPLWDPRNGLKITRRRHERETSKHEPVRFTELSPERQEALREFAAEWGLTPWLARHLGGFE